MIIDCICGLKKFEVNSDQVPIEGRQVKCGVCSKEWFFKPNNNESALDIDNADVNTETFLTDEPLPSTTEDAISAAEQSNKFDLKFDDDSLPSKSEMDENLEKFKASRTKGKKTKLSQAARTRMLFYLLVLLLLVLVTVSIPYKETVLNIFPELQIIFEGLTPVYELIFKN